MKKLRKIFAVSVIALTVLAMSGVANNGAKAAAQAGDLIKKDGLSTVYYLGSDGKRYVFPHESVYFSWYKDFSGVVTVSASELSSYPLGANIVMRPGTKLVKITSDPSVYVVSPNGVLNKIQSEADAIALFGSNWARRVVDVADSFFTNYTIGTPLAAGQTPVGSIVKNAGSANIYYYDGTNYRQFATEAAFNANRLDMANVITIATAITAGGTTVTGFEDGIAKTSQSGVTPGTQPGNGTGLTVSLSSQTPAASSIPAGSPVEFLKINLTASADGNVNVSSIKLTAYDLSDPLNIDDVNFYDNGVKVGTSKNFTSDRIALFNFATPIVVNASSTKTLTVKATIAAGQTGNYGIGIAAASDVIAAGTSIAGSFPVRGNSMSVTSNTNIGDVDMSAVGTVDSTNNFGDDNVVLASFDLTANHETALLQTLNLKNGGTNVSDIVSNLKLLADGTEIATGTYSDGYVMFNVSNFPITKGDTISFEVRGDLGISNVNDTVNLYIKSKSDVVMVGKDYGFGVQINSIAALDAASDGIVVTLAAGAFTIDMNKTATPAKDVKAGDNDVALATLTLKSNGENATISQIADSGANDFEILGTGLTTGEIENVEMVDVATGGIYDITATFDTNKWTLSMTDEIALVKGVAKTFIIRADMSDTTGLEIDNGNTVYVLLDGSAMSITGDVSNAAITSITPSSVTSAVMTVKDASLTWNPVTLSTATIVGGASDVEVYRATLKAGTSDNVKLQTVKLSTTANTATSFTDNNITKLDLYLNGQLLKTISNDITEVVNGVSVGYVTFNSLNTQYNTITAGATVTLSVKATFASTLSPTGSFVLQTAGADITSRSVTGNKLITEDGTITGGSRTVTLTGNGTLKIELLKTDTKADENSYVLAGSETPANRYMGELKFTTANEKITVKRLALINGGTATSNDFSAVKLVKFVAGVPTVVATKTTEANGDVIFDPFNITFDANQATSLFIVAVANGINVDGDPASTATYGNTLLYNIDNTTNTPTATGFDSQATITLAEDAGAGVIAGEYSMHTVTTNTNIITGSYLTTVTNGLTDSVLAPGTGKTIGKYTFVFDNGNNRDSSNSELKAIFDKLVVSVSKSTAVVLTNVKAQIEGTSTKVAADTLATLGNGNTSGTATWNALTLQGLADGGKVDGTVTLVITADVAPSATDGEFVQTSLADMVGAADFHYIGSGETAGAALTAMYLPVSEVLGATLQE